jgi:acid phosphatase family membrane protein YuiD
MIIELFENRIFVACVLAFAIAQLIKMMIDWSEGSLSWASILETGGMPSSHSSVVTALAAAIYFETGASILFVIALIFSAVVIRDAFGVRQATGQNTKAIKEVIKTLRLDSKVDLKEIMGHTAFQAVVGVVIGLASAALVMSSAGILGLLSLIAASLYFAMPGLISNMAPIFAQKINLLNIPVDLGKAWRGKRLFGDHKTYRGFAAAIIVAIFFVIVQKWLYGFGFFREISYINYGAIGFLDVLLLGFLLGFGALFGDLVKSFIKRRLDVKPGVSFFPWDQLDFVVGILAFIWIFKAPTWEMAVALIVIAPFTHLLFRFMGYKLKITKEKI